MKTLRPLLFGHQLPSQRQRGSFRAGLLGPLALLIGCSVYGDELLAPTGDDPSGGGASGQPVTDGGTANGGTGAGGTAAGGTAGMAANAGAGPSGGAPTCPVLPEFATLDLLTDMERGAAIEPTDGRSGGWFALQEPTSSSFMQPAPGQEFFMTPLNPARGASAQAAHGRGGRLSDWGFSIGFELKSLDGTTVREGYDASRYAGFTFWARTRSGVVQSRAAVIVPETSTKSGLCGPPRPFQCGDNPGIEFTVTESW